jgi:hypothetical protein
MADEDKRAWYIRGMPTGMVEEIKAAAKADHMTVAQWLTATLGPILDKLPPPMDQGARIEALERDMEELKVRVETLATAAGLQPLPKRPKTPDELRAEYKRKVADRYG